MVVTNVIDFVCYSMAMARTHTAIASKIAVHPIASAATKSTLSLLSGVGSEGCGDNSRITLSGKMSAAESAVAKSAICSGSSPSRVETLCAASAESSCVMTQVTRTLAGVSCSCTCDV